MGRPLIGNFFKGPGNLPEPSLDSLLFRPEPVKILAPGNKFILKTGEKVFYVGQLYFNPFKPFL
jgi:hypothetical protein